MRILVATDSFKDACTAPEACRAIAAGIRRNRPDAEVVEFPLADGGEGTFDVLAWHLGLNTIEADTIDPLFRPIRGAYGLSADGRTAFIEMAQASGLQRLKPAERDPLRTTTLGTGILLSDARIRGATHIVLAIGGSATNDGGIGLATALGWRFLKKDKTEILPVGGQLGFIASIEPPEWALNLQRVDVICDVGNPLCGPLGAAYTYGRQKGADDASIVVLDAGLQHLAQLVQEQLHRPGLEKIPGAGAAGGLGFGAMAFLNAQLRQGIYLVMNLTRFNDALAGADLLITGEGRLDGQTLHGKLVFGISQRARRFGVPVIALCGQVDATEEQQAIIGLHRAVGINRDAAPLAQLLARTTENLERTAAALDLSGFQEIQR